jgi:hypothetical protein
MAQCVDNAALHVIPGMGHDLPEQLLPQLVGLIASHCAAADNASIGGRSEFAEIA